MINKTSELLRNYLPLLLAEFDINNSKLNPSRKIDDIIDERITSIPRIKGHHINDLKEKYMSKVDTGFTSLKNSNK